MAGIFCIQAVIAIYNITLDALPQDYDGYLIRTDFRIGIQISLCAEDQELSKYDKMIIMLNLLYGRAMPDFETAVKGLEWFCACGKPAKKSDDSGGEIMSFDYDDRLIYSAFKRAYGIDLSAEKMHWFKFVSLLQDIQGTALCDIIGYRTVDTSKMEKEQRAAYEKMKQKVRLPVVHTEEENEKSNEFFSKLNQNK